MIWVFYSLGFPCPYLTSREIRRTPEVVCSTISSIWNFLLYRLTALEIGILPKPLPRTGTCSESSSSYDLFLKSTLYSMGWSGANKLTERPEDGIRASTLNISGPSCMTTRDLIRDQWPNDMLCNAARARMPPRDYLAKQPITLHRRIVYGAMFKGVATRRTPHIDGTYVSLRERPIQISCHPAIMQLLMPHPTDGMDQANNGNSTPQMQVVHKHNRTTISRLLPPSVIV
ncbi:hypothetical protein BKA67DRAFT_684460 [Truncatella angustata]|uniref:Uncharacterized protein n=1 Tax=Truncatella angustata TaxID=152316 RepID=A0A9P8RJ50_9PEZI|nr:uncharacterized protein BKA67DRAFT_684460 [Truncatella angustata]KAH6646988.1 hypothetical protein BKA67DRAFT_684460 [Truncatella angustata]